MNIKFIEQNPLHLLISIDVDSQAELDSALNEVDETVLFRALITLTEQNKIDPTEFSDLGGSLTSEQLGTYRDKLQDFPQALLQTSYDYKLELFVPFLDDLLFQALILNESLRERFAGYIHLLRDIISQEKALTDSEQQDLAVLWDELRAICMVDLDLFNYDF